MDQERIIYILDYLSRYTDEKKSVSIKEIQDHLANVCNLTRVNDVTLTGSPMRVITSLNITVSIIQLTTH